MATALLETKFFRTPPRPDLVARPHLFNRPHNVMQPGCRLALISTLVSSWVEACGCTAFWLSLDEGNNEPVRFWSYLAAAANKIKRGIGDAVEHGERWGSVDMLSGAYLQLARIKQAQRNESDMCAAIDKLLDLTRDKMPRMLPVVQIDCAAILLSYGNLNVASAWVSKKTSKEPYRSPQRPRDGNLATSPLIDDQWRDRQLPPGVSQYCVHPYQPYLSETGYPPALRCR
jgi:hypothetical protein